MPRLFAVVLLWLWSAVCTQGAAPVLTEVASDFPAVRSGSAKWGDYDNDGDLDLLVSGNLHGPISSEVTALYRNEGGRFTLVPSQFAPYRSTWMEWGDVDNDGFLDFVITGLSFAVPTNFVRIYKNLEGQDFALFQGLLGLDIGRAVWGDFDRDGWSDLAMSGLGILSPNFTRLYRNERGGNFRPLTNEFTELIGDIGWGDFDNNGWLDLFNFGIAPSFPYTRLYLYPNTEGVFSRVQLMFSLSPGAAEWFDFNNDGWVDLLAGIHSDKGTHVMINEQGSLRPATLLPTLGATALGDYDNDGFTDVLISGYYYDELAQSFQHQFTHVYHNEGNGSWTQFSNFVLNCEASITAWGDYDNDGDLDLFLAGQTPTNYTSRLYRNDIAKRNTAPTAPNGLDWAPNRESVVLSWETASDAEQSSGLTYNVRVGTAPGEGDVVNPLSLPSGYRKVVSRGNAGTIRTFPLYGLQPGQRYYWSVQAVDNTYAGSPFAEERQFVATSRPTVSAVPDQVIREDAVPSEVPFVIGDFETPAELLHVTVSSANRNVIDESGMAITGSSSNRAVVLAPLLNSNGVTSITIEVTDSDGAVARRTFSVRVLPINDSPEIQDQIVRTREDSLLNVPVLASDRDGDVLTVTVNRPRNGETRYSGETVFYRPATNYFGSDIFTILVTDGYSQSTGTVFVTVEPVNDAPVAKVNIAPVFDEPFAVDRTFVLSRSGARAVVTLDASSSSDVDSLSLTFRWYDAGAPAGSGPVLTRTYGPGMHSVTMEVSDGEFNTTAVAQFEVITLREAIELLRSGLSHSHIPGYISRPLIVHLRAASAAIDRKDPQAMARFLRVFQHLVKGRLASTDAALARALANAAQQIIDASPGTPKIKGGFVVPN